MADAELRAIFNQDAELYDKARPNYPDELVNDLGELAEIGPGTRLAEIGPGTGQATAVLATRGAHVVAIELGPELAAVLRRKLTQASVEVVVSAFEDWPLPKEPFDALCAFTAWHWLDLDVRTIKAAAALRPGGTLATVTTIHVSGGTDAFFADAQSCYERWDPATHQAQHLPAAEAVPPAIDEVDASELFLPAVRRRYQQDVAYTTSSYLDVLRTYSGHRALRPDRRQRLLTCIAELIDGKYGGMIVKRYLYELRVARTYPPEVRGYPDMRPVS
ncbi:MAG: class I SAM-dependent methyltransferase [Pseudonocardiaceae bacterium]